MGRGGEVVLRRRWVVTMSPARVSVVKSAQRILILTVAASRCWRCNTPATSPACSLQQSGAEQRGVGHIVDKGRLLLIDLRSCSVTMGGLSLSPRARARQFLAVLAKAPHQVAFRPA